MKTLLKYSANALTISRGQASSIFLKIIRADMRVVCWLFLQSTCKEQDDEHLPERVVHDFCQLYNRNWHKQDLTFYH